MNRPPRTPSVPRRPFALALALAMATGPLSACCGKSAPPPPVDDTRPGHPNGAPTTAEPHGMTTEKKLQVLLQTMVTLPRRNERSSEQSRPRGPKITALER